MNESVRFIGATEAASIVFRTAMESVSTRLVFVGLIAALLLLERFPI